MGGVVGVDLRRIRVKHRYKNLRSPCQARPVFLTVVCLFMPLDIKSATMTMVNEPSLLLTLKNHPIREPSDPRYLNTDLISMLQKCLRLHKEANTSRGTCHEY